MESATPCRSAAASVTLYTVGHSTRTWEELVDLLHSFDIRCVWDVRRYPGSRRFPQFERAHMETALPREEIAYQWAEALGGRRRSTAGASSPNQGLESPGLRAYADHMATDLFRQAVQRLVARAAATCSSVLCAERLYWKCHRRLLSDYLTSLGVHVVHLVEAGRCVEHVLTPGVVLQPGGGVLYLCRSRGGGPHAGGLFG
ncbi:MAG: DUF488 domain-containing protein [bacterium]